MVLNSLNLVSGRFQFQFPFLCIAWVFCSCGGPQGSQKTNTEAVPVSRVTQPLRPERVRPEQRGAVEPSQNLLEDAHSSFDFSDSSSSIESFVLRSDRSDSSSARTWLVLSDDDGAFESAAGSLWADSQRSSHFGDSLSQDPVDQSDLKLNWGFTIPTEGQNYFGVYKTHQKWESQDLEEALRLGVEAKNPEPASEGGLKSEVPEFDTASSQQSGFELWFHGSQPEDFADVRSSGCRFIPSFDPHSASESDSRFQSQRGRLEVQFQILNPEEGFLGRAWEAGAGFLKQYLPEVAQPVSVISPLGRVLTRNSRFRPKKTHEFSLSLPEVDWSQSRWEVPSSPFWSEPEQTVRIRHGEQVFQTSRDGSGVLEQCNLEMKLNSTQSFLQGALHCLDRTPHHDFSAGLKGDQDSRGFYVLFGCSVGLASQPKF
ncbi:MAG: hypothetical protein ACO3A2_01560 [Bdellovibrionia bacterium]